MFCSFYFWVFINWFFILLSKEKQENKINFPHILSYIIWTVWIITLLVLLKQLFGVYELTKLSLLFF